MEKQKQFGKKVCNENGLKRSIYGQAEAGDRLKDEDITGLVIRAQSGEKGAVDELSRAAAQRLMPYIYRLTLNYDAAEDILQETLLHMVKSLDDLKEPGSFWCWIFRTAYGKAQHYFRDRDRQKSISTDSFRRGWERCHDSAVTGYNYVIRKELAEIVVATVNKLNVNQRTVLALRCYEDMSYSQIGQVMNCKEMAARIMFYRAKMILKRDLVRRGFGKEHLLLALGLFGAITAKTEAASATTYVTASVLDVGMAAVLLSTVVSRGCAIMASLAALFSYLVTTHSFYYAVGFGILSVYVMFWLWFANLYSE
jgi:RNA polymerase sigma-70 factor (ECF subfamily)